MFATACHYIVACTLVRDPQGYADAVQCKNGIDASFKRNKNIPSMLDFMVDSILGGRRRNPLAAFDAVDASRNTPPLSPVPFYQPMQQRSPCSSVPSTSYENQQSTTKKRPLHQRFDSESSDDDQVHSPKKRKNPIELLCDDDETTEYQGEKNKGKAMKSSNKK